MTIPPGSALISPCAHIKIESTGESAYVHDGMYRREIFGTYRFVSIDERGNNMYHANIQGDDWFITKGMNNFWAVRTRLLYMLKYMM